MKNFIRFILFLLKNKRGEITLPREVKIGKTIYRLKSVFEGKKDMNAVIRRLAIKKAVESTAKK